MLFSVRIVRQMEQCKAFHLLNETEKRLFLLKIPVLIKLRRTWVQKMVIEFETFQLNLLFS